MCDVVVISLQGSGSLQLPGNPPSLQALVMVVLLLGGALSVSFLAAIPVLIRWPSLVQRCMS